MYYNGVMNDKKQISAEVPFFVFANSNFTNNAEGGTFYQIFIPTFIFKTWPVKVLDLSKYFDNII